MSRSLKGLYITEDVDKVMPRYYNLIMVLKSESGGQVTAQLYSACLGAIASMPPQSFREWATSEYPDFASIVDAMSDDDIRALIANAGG